MFVVGGGTAVDWFGCYMKEQREQSRQRALFGHKKAREGTKRGGGRVCVPNEEL